MKLTLDSLPMYCEEAGDCLLWKLGTNGQGYPQANIDGKPVMVRRYVFETLLGKRLGKYKPLRTRCESKLCVSPECIRSTTHSDLLRRAYSSGARNTIDEYRDRLERCKANGWAKMTHAQVAEMRATCGGLSYSEIGRRYGIHHKTAAKIMRGESWRINSHASSVFNWRGTVAVNDERAAA